MDMRRFDTPEIKASAVRVQAGMKAASQSMARVDLGRDEPFLEAVRDWLIAHDDPRWDGHDILELSDACKDFCQAMMQAGCL